MKTIEERAETLSTANPTKFYVIRNNQIVELHSLEERRCLDPDYADCDDAWERYYYMGAEWS